MSQEIVLSRSEFTENFLYLDGKPFSLDDYPHMRAIYNSPAPEIVLKTSRQVGKSTSLANIMITNSAMIKYFRTLFVAPTVEQTKVFSHDRVNPALEGSPFIKDYYMNSTIVQNVFMKQLLNGSRMYLRYALLSADRLRGYCKTHLHQYLTLRGWVDVKDLTIDDLVLTKNEGTNELEYQKPSEIIIEDYDGPIHYYSQRGRVVHEVTPEHRMHADMLTQKHEGSPFGTGWQTDIRSKDIHTQNFRLGIGDPNTLHYKDSSPGYFELPELKTSIKADGTPYRDGQIRTYSSIKLPIKPFMAFMGWWLSEGWTTLSSPAFGVAQDKKHNPAYWEEVNNLMAELFPSHTASQDGNQWFCQSEYRTLYEWLKPLGKSGDKRIPRELLNYTKYLPDLLDALYKGDGDNIKNGKRKSTHKKHLRLTTKSLELANTVQEAWLRLGKWCSIVHRDRKHGRIYSVELRSRTYTNYLLNKYKKTKHKYFEEKNYKGKIYCVVVPNGNFITRHSETKVPLITGNSADMLCFDEAQDLRAEIVPIAQEAMNRSMYKHTLYAGTPKRSRGTLADLWFESTQAEFMPKCEHCNHWNLLDYDSIGDLGPICKKCGKILSQDSLKAGQWVSTGPKDPAMEGYRVCVLHFTYAPWIDWKRDVIEKRRRQPRAIFFNETLGLEYDEGTSPITKQDIVNCCDPSYSILTPQDPRKIPSTIMGLDYGPVNSEKSHTVSVVVSTESSKYRVHHMKKFLGKEADYAYIHKEVPRMLSRWNAQHLASDYGMGEAPNSEIRSKIGFERVIAFQHVPSQKEKVKWNVKMPAYTLNRTQVITELFKLIKDQRIIFPKWEETEEFAEDLLNVYADYDEDRNLMKYINVGPDDFLHALIFAVISNEMINGLNNF